MTQLKIAKKYFNLDKKMHKNCFKTKTPLELTLTQSVF